MMSNSIEFADGLGAALQLGAHAQAELVAVISHRLAEQGALSGGTDSEESALLPDPGRVLMPARGVRKIAARVFAAGRQAPRLRAEADLS